MRRKLFNLLAAISLGLLIAVVTLGVRGYFVYDNFCYERIKHPSGGGALLDSIGLESSQGGGAAGAVPDAHARLRTMGHPAAWLFFEPTSTGGFASVRHQQPARTDCWTMGVRARGIHGENRELHLRGHLHEPGLHPPPLLVPRPSLNPTSAVRVSKRPWR